MQATAATVQALKHAKPPKPVALGQGHGAGGSDRQAGAAAAAAGANHATAGVGTHAHPETGDALALATGAFQRAPGHDSLSFPAFLTVRHPISRVVGPQTGAGAGAAADSAEPAGVDQLGSIWISQLPRTPDTGMSPGAWARALNWYMPALKGLKMFM